MDFEELCEKVGVELAVVIAQKNFPVGFWEKITLNVCFSIYKRVSGNSELSKIALTKVMEKEGTFNEWLNIYRSVLLSYEGEKLKKFALAKMIKNKGTLNEWSEVYESVCSDSELKKAALEQLKLIYNS
ncbi:MAG TPA: hypothetical protein VMZ91_00970 [Candidatus Paceibacterota bacterium]|nr:hypothetical protein [Candidatus Paceibacterota bacterium]